jgi:hypothetical protein
MRYHWRQRNTVTGVYRAFDTGQAVVWMVGRTGKAVVRPTAAGDEITADVLACHG